MLKLRREQTSEGKVAQQLFHHHVPIQFVMHHRQHCVILVGDGGGDAPSNDVVSHGFSAAIQQNYSRVHQFYSSDDEATLSDNDSSG